jgi:hypothetical protein
MKKSRKSTKRILEEAYKLVESWSAGYRLEENVILAPFMEALKQYDDQEFFEHYAHGLDRALAQLRKEKAE